MFFFLNYQNRSFTCVRIIDKDIDCILRFIKGIYDRYAILKHNTKIDKELIMLDDDIRYPSPILSNLSSPRIPLQQHALLHFYLDPQSGPAWDIPLSCPFQQGIPLQPFSPKGNTLETAHVGRRKSVFHNFQKHLLTFVKKTLLIDLCNKKKQYLPPLCSQIIQAFLRTSSYNKQALHMLVGVGSRAQEVEVTRASFPHFREATSGVSADEVVEAQEVLRGLLVEQGQEYTRERMVDKCSMERFQAFFEYYSAWLAEIRAGPMSRRLSKPRKCNALERLRQRHSTYH